MLEEEKGGCCQTHVWLSLLPPPHPPTTNGAKAIAGIAIGIGTEMQSLTNATIWKA